MVIVIVIIIIIYLLFPFIMDWFIIGNSIPSNICNKEWVGFLGSYIGSLLSMTGVICTIWFTYIQKREDRDLQIQPYCSVKLEDNANWVYSIEKTLGICQATFLDDTQKTESHLGILKIKNIGLGPALDCSITCNTTNNNVRLFLMPSNNEEEIHVDAMKILEKDEYGNIYFYMVYEGNNLEKTNGQEIQNAAHNSFSITIDLIYHDFFRNRYIQKITLDACFGMNLNTSRNQQELFVFVLRDVTTPQKSKSKSIK